MGSKVSGCHILSIKMRYILALTYVLGAHMFWVLICFECSYVLGVHLRCDNSLLSGDPNKRASEGKPVAIDVTTIKGVKFLGVTGDIKVTKASIIKKLLWDFLKTVRPGL